MAWTTPATYSVSEVVTASKLNAHIRDNLRYLKGLDGVVTVENELNTQLAAGGSLVIEGTAASSFARMKMLGKTAASAVVDWRFLANGVGTSEFSIYEAANERLRIASGGNVGIGYSAPQGRLHVGGNGGGVIFLSESAVDSTLRTVAIAGTVVRSACFWVLDHNNTTNTGVLNFNGTQIATGGSNTITNTDTITVSVTAGGAITVQRTAGVNGTHNMNGWIVYR